MSVLSESEIERRIINNDSLFNTIHVATIKLGMGYDKGDISFIVHYQMPANIVSYRKQKRVFEEIQENIYF